MDYVNSRAHQRKIGIKMRRSGRKTLLIRIVCLCILLIVPPPAARATDVPPVAGSWTGSGVVSNGWRQIPGDGKWSSFEVGRSDDPYEYKFELLCLISDNNFDKACLAATVQCTAAEGGLPVIWLKALKAARPASWEFMTGPTCIYSEKPRDILEEIAARIEQDFKNSKIAPANVTSQPGPNTLRGAETNFYADAKEQTFDIELLGQRVHINAIPTEYTWTYGDGTAVGPTPYPGAPLPEARWGEKTATSHVYTQTGDYPVTVATRFHGTYSVNGGPPLPIPGQGTFISAPVQLSVWRSETKNYADNCNQNPQGDGCPGVPAKP